MAAAGVPNYFIEAFLKSEGIGFGSSLFRFDEQGRDRASLFEPDVAIELLWKMGLEIVAR